MQTPYDWITIAIFAGLIVIFLQRSVPDDEPQDSIWSYLPPSVGCAVANYLGNEGYDAFAVIVIVAVLAYSYFVLKPFGRRK
ncbi:XrtV sorting system accessory protein [Sphingomonas flavalba]|uniref:XrtV sorting system accessory protein n=1 Tax=Sphingomonas flavalba TaxID=2559804 RepID=UPI00109E1670|nr:XrtV sorting system accessory protein [Sphingomonas flavalba]